MATVDRPGFQQSITSGAEVTIYPSQYNPLGLRTLDQEKIVLNRDSKPALISVQYSKNISSPSGQFSFSFKPGPDAQLLFDEIQDDDWVDIVLFKHQRRWHVCRGLIDSIQRVTSVSGTGATVTAFTVVGRTFSKIWEITPVWFNPYADQDIAVNVAASKAFKSFENFQGPPPDVVEAYLRNFLEDIGDAQGPDWKMPPSMPGALSEAFIANVVFENKSYSDIPKRRVFNANPMLPDGTLWDLALSVGDQQMLEIYADLLPDGGNSISADLGNPEVTWDIDETTMTVVTRDRPFPVVSTPEAGGDTYEDYWADLPVAEIARQELVSLSVTKSGFERFNAYWISTLITPENDKTNSIPLLAPVIDKQDIKHHGLRRYDVQSQMGAALDSGVTFSDLAQAQRKITRDWFVLNPYFLAGAAAFGHGRPDILPGMRLRIVPSTKDGAPENYYVEGVQHVWQLQSGIRTTLELTRGFRGTDVDLRKAIEKASANYIVPKLISQGGNNA
jgi:hypothetical protein